MNLDDVPAIDQHAHNLLKSEFAEREPFASAFTESGDPALVMHHASHTLFYRRSLREIADLLGCEPSEDVILSRRREMGERKLTALCFEASILSAVFLDDGLLPEKSHPWEWHRQFVPVRRILRIESLAETLLESSESFDSFVDAFRSRIDPPSRETVAFKSIAAYRSGLKITPVTEKTARSRFPVLRHHKSSRNCRLSDKAFIEYLITLTLDAASTHGLPVQFHTGFGDADLDLRLSNPLHLRRILEDPRWRKVPVVLLHGGYPFTREAGYLASVYPQVHVDAGLSVPFLSASGMRALLQQLLELAPTTKIMFSSDARLIPEMYYLAAKWGRRTLGDVLDRAVADSDLTAEEAERSARRILHENARRLYLEGRH